MSIPKEAKRLFKGIIFDVYQWEQKQFDGTTKTFEMLKRKGSVQMLPIVEDKIIVLRESQPTISERYGLVGGQQDENEDSLTAAKREMMEETGFASENWNLFCTRTVSTKLDWTISTYIARDCKKIANPRLDGGEKITPLLVSFDEFMEIILDKNFRSKDLTLDILTLHYRGKLDEFKKMLFK